MPLLVKQYKNGKYGLYSTIIDKFITKPSQLTRAQAIDVLIERAECRYREKIEEIKNEFPNGYADYDTGAYILKKVK